MLSLMILVGLGLWVLVVIGAAYLGRKLGLKYYKTARAGNLGAFLGFMLTMGGFIVYWTVEFYQIQARVSYLCKTEGGLKVFVTPEEYKRRLQNNDWMGLPKYAPQIKGQFDNMYITYNGIDYQLDQKNKDQIQDLGNSDDLHPHVPYVKDFGSVIYDTQHQVVLSQLIMYSVGGGSIANELSALKFWLDSINDCYSKLDQNKRYELKKQYIIPKSGIKS